MHRPAFAVTFVAEPGVDGIKSIRALLKLALRRFGLRAIDVRTRTGVFRIRHAQPGRQP